MTDHATAALARYGISIGFLPDGDIELIGQRGVSCKYSARGFCPVIGLGAPDGAVNVRLRADGVAELRICGTVHEYRKNDPARSLSVPTDDLDDLIKPPTARKAKRGK